MNTTEIIAKLRAQAAELIATADALEAASSHNGAGLCPRTGAGRYLIHGAVKVGDWTTWENVPAMSLVEDTTGDYAAKGEGWSEWVGISHGGRPHVRFDSLPDLGTSELKRDSRCRIIALGLTGLETADDIRSLVERFKASRVPA